MRRKRFVLGTLVALFLLSGTGFGLTQYFRNGRYVLPSRNMKGALEAILTDVQMQVDANAAGITGLDARVTTNEMDIAQNAMDIGTNAADIAQNAMDIANLQFFRRLGGTGFVFLGTSSGTYTTIVSTTIPANTITDFILVTCPINHNSSNTAGSTAEVSLRLQINGITRDTQDWTQTQSGVFPNTFTHSTFAQAYVPSAAEMSAPLTVTVQGRSDDGRTKNFNLQRLDIMGR